MTYKLVATMASGFEAITAKELNDLGYETKTDNGRVLFHGELEDIARTNLWLRSADRVKIILDDFDAVTFEELFDKIYNMPWDDYLPMNAHIPVNARSVKSKLFSTRDIQAISKKAIVKKMAEVYNRRNGMLPESGSTFSIEVRIIKNHAEVTLDTTGDSLFKRGYRIEHGGAPLKENFAAALVMITNWRSDMPFWDPTTGSGTIAIEAAMIGKNIAPGLNRHFLFEGFNWFDQQILENQKQLAKSEIKDVKLNINASDIDQNMIDVAKLNANNAGVLHDINFKQIALKDLKIEEDNGVLIANPPYGVRMKDTEEVHILYKQMGDIFEKLNHWSKYYLTSDLDFQGFYGKQATKRRKLYNGAIRTDYFQYWA
ncbi:RNA methyltransferase [Companilactobacillus sp. RD055328]|uniref:THUMP domain-containing class I SAM-dependent RNA methyltransferase n=1 Tax=Companilactobacillus sp. RD055328 TaxID=2916634 RepID=UPI001FC7E021|nr:class I SAM-dependent RNA methyltransferase [Companilactobacillus sp. RD055328]GKQ42690.1 RNA methyltransferase [Companilactobacillus sp. RD055328]